jgi:hypothetical protein
VLPAAYDEEAKARVHVITAHLEPFWSIEEVERVLGGLRALCGVHTALTLEAGVLPRLGMQGLREACFYEAQGGSGSATCMVGGLADARLPGESLKDFLERAKPSAGDHVTQWIALENRQK